MLSHSSCSAGPPKASSSWTFLILRLARASGTSPCRRPRRPRRPRRHSCAHRSTSLSVPRHPRAGSGVGLEPVAPPGTKDPGDNADEQQHAPDQPQGLDHGIGLGHRHSSLLPEVGRLHLVEVDHPPQHLQIGHEGIHLGELPGLPSSSPTAALGYRASSPSRSASGSAWARRSASALATMSSV